MEVAYITVPALAIPVLKGGSMAVKAFSGPFVVRLSQDGEADQYLRDGERLREFPTMVHAFDYLTDRVPLEGWYPAVVPIACVPVEQR